MSIIGENIIKKTHTHFPGNFSDQESSVYLEHRSGMDLWDFLIRLNM